MGENLIGDDKVGFQKMKMGFSDCLAAIRKEIFLLAARAKFHKTAEVLAWRQYEFARNPFHLFGTMRWRKPLVFELLHPSCAFDRQFMPYPRSRRNYRPFVLWDGPQTRKVFYSVVWVYNGSPKPKPCCRHVPQSLKKYKNAIYFWCRHGEHFHGDGLSSDILAPNLHRLWQWLRVQ